MENPSVNGYRFIGRKFMSFSSELMRPKIIVKV